MVFQRQAGGARDSNSDLWSYLENLSAADRALDEKVIELAASYAASVTGADDNPKIIGYGRRSSDHCGRADWRSMMLTAILLGLAYMVFNEWLNVGIRRSWSYTEAIPFYRHSALVS